MGGLGSANLPRPLCLNSILKPAVAEACLALASAERSAGQENDAQQNVNDVIHLTKHQ